MEIFTLRGTRGEFITLTLPEPAERPTDRSIEGGVDLKCILHAEIGSYVIRGAPCWSATGPLERFGRELKACYETLSGQARYGLTYEQNLELTVTMVSGGRAEVTGRFREDPAAVNCLTFAFETDQTCLPPAIHSLERLGEML